VAGELLQQPLLTRQAAGSASFICSAWIVSAGSELESSLDSGLYRLTHMSRRSSCHLHQQIFDTPVCIDLQYRCMCFAPRLLTVPCRT
jgi:hypothetical protein